MTGISTTLPADKASADAADPLAEHLQALLGRCARGESGALEELYRKTSSQLLACLIAVLRRRELAEEALQDVFVRIWQRANQFDAYRGRPMSWLVSIARNHAIDLIRQRKPMVSIDDEHTATIEDPAALEQFEVTESGRTSAALQRCLKQLSVEQRRCISLAYVDGYSHEEIANVVASPLGTVKSWMRRGLMGLKRCMDS